jgi:hypothetical protein
MSVEVSVADHLVPPALLGVVKGHIRPLYQHSGVEAVLRERRNTNRHGDLEGAFVRVENQRTDVLTDSLGQSQRTFQVGCLEHDGEFFPTVARGDIDLSCGLLEHPGDPSQDLVANRVAVGVVLGFLVLDKAKKQGGRVSLNV